MAKQEKIEFRAINKKTGEWFYWTIENSFNGTWQNMVDHEVEINWETFGRNTGLRDRNGSEIFEGDVIRMFGRYRKKNSVYGYCHRGKKHDRIISWINTRNYRGFRVGTNPETYEVIGDIHKNKELL